MASAISGCFAYSPRYGQVCGELDISKKVGRPELDEEKRRDERVALRLTMSEKAHLETQAAQANMTVASFARSLIFDHRLPAMGKAADDAILCELNRIGVVFNALASARFQGCDPDELASTMSLFRATLEKVGRDHGS